MFKILIENLYKIHQKYYHLFSFVQIITLQMGRLNPQIMTETAETRISLCGMFR